MVELVLVLVTVCAHLAGEASTVKKVYVKYHKQISEYLHIIIIIITMMNSCMLS